MRQTSSAIRNTRQRGAILILMALLIVPLTVMTAIVVDLGLVRWQRATMQNSVDSAAVAAGNMLSAKGSGSPNGDGQPQAACTAALASLRQNLSGFTSTDVGDVGGCAGLPALVSACITTPTTQTLTATSGNYTATFTYPIPSSATPNATLASERVAYVGASVTNVDPNSVPARCRVMGVQVKRSNMPTYFGGVVGATSQSATARADGATPATSTTTITTTTTLPCNTTPNYNFDPSAFTRNPAPGGGSGLGTTLTAPISPPTSGCGSPFIATWTVGKTWSNSTVPASNLTVINPPAVQLANIESDKANYGHLQKAGWIEATLSFTDPVTGQPVSVTNLNFTISHIQQDEQVPPGTKTSYRRSRVWLSDAKDLDRNTAGSVLPPYSQPGGTASGNGTGFTPWIYPAPHGSGSPWVTVNFAGPVSLVKVHFDILGFWDGNPVGWPNNPATINISGMSFTGPIP